MLSGQHASYSNNCYRYIAAKTIVQLHILVHMIGKRGGKGGGIRPSSKIRTYNLQHGLVFLEKKKTAETTQPQAII